VVTFQFGVFQPSTHTGSEGLGLVHSGRLMIVILCNDLIILVTDLLEASSAGGENIVGCENTGLVFGREQ